MLPGPCSCMHVVDHKGHVQLPHPKARSSHLENVDLHEFSFMVKTENVGGWSAAKIPPLPLLGIYLIVVVVFVPFGHNISFYHFIYFFVAHGCWFFYA